MNWTIFAPTASFKNVEEAASGEGKLDWLGAIGPEHDACTLSFAAQEIAQCFRLPDSRVDLQPWTGQTLSGNCIVLLTPATLAAQRKTIEQTFGAVQPPAGDQAFTIRTRQTSAGTQYLILGGGRAGALYGAYELLDAFGFRWLGPEDHEAQAPAQSPQTSPRLETTQAPSFSTRGYWLFTNRGGNRFVLWMARNRLNLWSVGAEDKAYCRKLGMTFQAGFHDAMERYLPPAKYFKPHPEWYGLRNGKRSSNVSAGLGDNFCCSNAAGRAQFAENLVQDLVGGDLRWVDFYTVGTSDGGNWCECDACRKLGSPTDQLMLLLHECRQAVRRAVADKRLHRDVKMGVAAYLETKDPPTRPLPPDFDHAGTFVTFFPIERCYAHPFVASNCTELNVGLRALYEGWTGDTCAFRGAKFIGEYYNVSKYAGMMLPFMKIMAADIPYFHQTGARMMHYMHPVVSDWGALSLTNLQFAAQLWNHRLDCDQFFTRYLRDRYGACAESMRQVYMLVEAAMRNVQVLKHTPHLKHQEGKDHLFHTLRQKGDPAAPKTYFRSRHLSFAPQYQTLNDGPSLVETVELLDQAGKLLDQVLLRGDHSALVAQRLAAHARRFNYTRNLAQFYYHIARVRIFENQSRPELAAQEARVLRDIGETLRAEDRVTRNGCEDSEVLFKNGLMATYLSQPYRQIMADYDLPVPEIEKDGVD